MISAVAGCASDRVVPVRSWSTHAREIAAKRLVAAHATDRPAAPGADMAALTCGPGAFAPNPAASPRDWGGAATEPLALRSIRLVADEPEPETEPASTETEITQIERGPLPGFPGAGDWRRVPLHAHLSRTQSGY